MTGTKKVTRFSFIFSTKINITNQTSDGIDKPLIDNKKALKFSAIMFSIEAWMSQSLPYKYKTN